MEPLHIIGFSTALALSVIGNVAQFIKRKGNVSRKIKDKVEQLNTDKWVLKHQVESIIKSRSEIAEKYENIKLNLKNNQKAHDQRIEDKDLAIRHRDEQIEMLKEDASQLKSDKAYLSNIQEIADAYADEFQTLANRLEEASSRLRRKDIECLTKSKPSDPQTQELQSSAKPQEQGRLKKAGPSSDLPDASSAQSSTKSG